MNADVEAARTLLSVRDLTAGYGDVRVLTGVSLEVQHAEVTVVLGRNGAGKTTLLHAIAGLARGVGSLHLDGQEVSGPAYRRANSGIALVQEGKRIFRLRTVEENLRLGGYGRISSSKMWGRKRRAWLAAGFERSYELFPDLRDRRKAPAGQLSGGQQQMLAVAQALMSEPKLLLLDEPSAGLAPQIVSSVFSAVRSLTQSGLGILLVEQLVDQSVAMADTVVVLEDGRVSNSWDAADVDLDRLHEAYFGASGG